MRSTRLSSEFKYDVYDFTIRPVTEVALQGKDGDNDFVTPIKILKVKLYSDGGIAFSKVACWFSVYHPV